MTCRRSPSLELSPVIARPDGVQAVDGRIRIQAAEPADAHLRLLPVTDQSAAQDPYRAPGARPLPGASA